MSFQRPGRPTVGLTGFRLGPWSELISPAGGPLGGSSRSTSSRPTMSRSSHYGNGPELAHRQRSSTSPNGLRGDGAVEFPTSFGQRRPSAWFPQYRPQRHAHRWTWRQRAWRPSAPESPSFKPHRSTTEWHWRSQPHRTGRRSSSFRPLPNVGGLSRGSEPQEFRSPSTRINGAGLPLAPSQ